MIWKNAELQRSMEQHPMHQHLCDRSLRGKRKGEKNIWRKNNPFTKSKNLILLCCAYSLSHVQLFVTPWTVPLQAPLSMGILQARILEWVARPSSRGSSQHRDWTLIFCIDRQILYHLCHQGNLLGFKRH